MSPSEGWSINLTFGAHKHISKIPNNFLDNIVRVLYIAEPLKLSDSCYNLQPMIVLELKYSGVHALDSSIASTKILSIHFFLWLD